MTDQPSFAKLFPELVIVQSTRLGGVSPFPYERLNLGLYTKDDPRNVAINQQRVFQKLGIEEQQVARSYQVHEDKILIVEKPGDYKGYDALICNKAMIFPLVYIADCTPVLVYDPVANIVAAIHAGWRGTVQHIVGKTINAMKCSLKSKPENCYAWIGTCIDENDFEVDEDVACHFTDKHKRWDEERQKFFIDLKMANKLQLLEQGIDENKIEVSVNSTVRNNDRYFSHRKEQARTGRMMAIIGIKK